MSNDYKSISEATMEACMSTPGVFTSKEIYAQVKQLFPEAKLSVIQNYVSYVFVKRGVIEKTDKKVTGKKGQPVGVYKVTGKKPDMKHKKSTAVAKKTAKKKPAPVAPTGEITDVQLGVAVINYIDALKAKLQNVTRDLSSAMEREKNETTRWRQIVREKEAVIEDLKKNNQIMKNRLRSSGKTFNIAEMGATINGQKR